MSEKRCRYCARHYEPYARAAERQKHCGLSECRRKHKRARDRAWRSKDAEWRRARQVLGDHPKPAISDHFKTGQR